MDYNNVIELDNVTLSDCEELFIMKDMFVEINNGHITNIVKGE
jgi:hypothetical protein